MTNTIDVSTRLRKIVDQMLLGARRMAILLAHVAIILGLIGMVYLLFKSGIIPTVDLRFGKSAGAMVKPIAEVWM